MNETQNNKSSKWTIAGLIGLILVLFVAIKLIFAGLGATIGDKYKEQPEENSYEVVDAKTGEASDYLLSIAGSEEIGLDAVEEWLDRCVEKSPEGDFHWLMYTDPDSWEAFIYLPGLTQTVTNQNISVEVTEEEEGKTLVVYLNTLGLEEGAQPREQMLHFAVPSAGAWPGRVSVVQNGAELTGTACIYNSGQMFWSEEMGN